MDRVILKSNKIKLGVISSEKKFSNNSNPTPNLQNKKIFDLAFKATHSKK